MWTRKDQMQAYQFLRRRLVSALVLRAANHAESPAKRLISAMVTGVLIVLLIMAGFGIYGLFVPGSSASWTAGDRVIVEKETGALFVLDSTQTLRPVLNYASAALFLGTELPAVTNVSQKSLRSRPRGTTIGIPGAPASVPTSEALLSGPWTACSETPLDQGGPDAPQVSLIVGGPELGTELATNDGLLVIEPASNDAFIIEGGRAYQVASPEVSQALGFAGATAIPVGSAWLNTVPRGADLDFVTIPDAGETGPSFSDQPSVIGQVFVVSRGDSQQPDEYLVALPDGVAPISQTQAELIVANPAAAGANPDGRATEMTAAVEGQAPVSTQDVRQDVPPTPPVPKEVSGDRVSVCTTAVASGSSTLSDAVTVSLSDQSPITDKDSAIEVDGASLPESQAGRLADVVSVRPGRGVLVEESTAAGAARGASYLVTDEGRRYPMDLQLAATFGYSQTSVAVVPKGFVALLPSGPQLSQQGASTPLVPGPLPEPVSPRDLVQEVKAEAAAGFGY